MSLKVKLSPIDEDVNGVIKEKLTTTINIHYVEDEMSKIIHVRCTLILFICEKSHTEINVAG